MNRITYGIIVLLRIFSLVPLLRNTVVVFSGGNFGFSVHGRANYEFAVKTFVSKKVFFVTGMKAEFGYYYKRPMGFLLLHLCRFIISDNSIPFSVNLKNKKVFQTWHGMPIKKIGLDDSTLVKSLSPTALNALIRQWRDTSNIICSCVQMRDVFKTAFGVREEQISIGFTPYLQKVYERAIRLPRDSRIKSILYLPTYRDWKSERSWDLLEHRDFIRAVSQLNIDLYYKYHPLDSYAAQRNIGKKFINLGARGEFLDVLSKVDLFVTDYSSGLFDALMLGNRIALYSKDLDVFEEKRGLYDRKIFDSFYRIDRCLDYDEIVAYLGGQQSPTSANLAEMKRRYLTENRNVEISL